MDLALKFLGFILSLFFGRKDGAAKQAGRDAQKVDDAAAVMKEVAHAKQIDAAVDQLADGSAAEQLRREFSRPSD